MRNGQDTRAPQQLFDWMTSLADPTRLRLLRLLEQHELTVAELCEILQLPQSTVSRHLKVLSERAWLRSRHQGTANLYRMSQHQVHDAATRLWALSKEQSSDWPALKQDRLRLEQHLDRRRTADFFAQAARSWEQLREELHGSNFMRAVLASLIDPELSVVDLGCGTGELLRLLAPRARQVLGVDRSQEMLEAASERVGGYENARLIRADLAALPLASGLWDAVTMLLVLSYLPRRAQGAPPRRARDAGADGAAPAVRGQAAAEGRADRGLAAHDGADRGADRDAGRARRRGALGVVQHLQHAGLRGGGGRRRHRRHAEAPRAPRCSRGRARRSRSTGGAPVSCSPTGRRATART
jgi:DNA-binding transcriptional ArsR family regulator